MRKTLKATISLNLWPYGEFLPLVHSAKKRKGVLFCAQDIFQGSTTQINIFLFIYIHLTSLSLRTDKTHVN